MSITTLCLADRARSGIPVDFLFPLLTDEHDPSTVQHPFHWNPQLYPCPDYFAEDARIAIAVQQAVAASEALARLKPQTYREEGTSAAGCAATVGADSSWDEVRATSAAYAASLAELEQDVEERSTIYDRKELMLQSIHQCRAEAEYNIAIVWLRRASAQTNGISTAIQHFLEASGLFDALMRQPCLKRSANRLELTADYLRVLSAASLASAIELSAMYYLKDSFVQLKENIELAHRAQYYFSVANSVVEHTVGIPVQEAWRNFLTIKTLFYEGLTLYLKSMEPEIRTGDSRRRRATEAFRNAQLAARAGTGPCGPNGSPLLPLQRPAVAAECAWFAAHCKSYRSLLRKGRLPEFQERSYRCRVTGNSVFASVPLSDDLQPMLPSPDSVQAPLVTRRSQAAALTQAEKMLRGQVEVTAPEKDIVLEWSMVQQDIRFQAPLQVMEVSARRTERTAPAALSDFSAEEEGEPQQGNEANTSQQTTTSPSAYHRVDALLTVRSPALVEVQPCALAILVDLNDLASVNTEVLRNSIVNPLQQTSFRDSDLIGLIEFGALDSKPTVAFIPATAENRRQICTRIMKLKGRGRFSKSKGTCLFRGIDLALEALAAHTNIKSKHVVVVSNGGDRSAYSDVDDCARVHKTVHRAVQFGIPVHTASLSYSANDILLEIVATGTGGVFAREVEDNAKKGGGAVDVSVFANVAQKWCLHVLTAATTAIGVPTLSVAPLGAVQLSSMRHASSSATEGAGGSSGGAVEGAIQVKQTDVPHEMVRRGSTATFGKQFLLKSKSAASNVANGAFDLKLPLLSAEQSSHVIATFLVPVDVAMQDIINIANISLSVPRPNGAPDTCLSTPLIHVNTTELEDRGMNSWLTQLRVREFYGHSLITVNADEAVAVMGNEALCVNDTLSTHEGGYVSLRCPDGSSVDVFPNTEIRIDRVDKSVLHLHVGKGIVQVSTSSGTVAKIHCEGYETLLEENTCFRQVYTAREFMAHTVTGSATISRQFVGREEVDVSEAYETGGHDGAEGSESSDNESFDESELTTVLLSSRQTKARHHERVPLDTPWAVTEDLTTALEPKAESHGDLMNASTTSTGLLNASTTSLFQSATPHHSKRQAFHSSWALAAKVRIETQKCRLELADVLRLVWQKQRNAAHRFTKKQRLIDIRCRMITTTYNLLRIRNMLANSIAYLSENVELDRMRLALEHVVRLNQNAVRSPKIWYAQEMRSVLRSVCWERPFWISPSGATTANTLFVNPLLRQRLAAVESNDRNQTSRTSQQLLQDDVTLLRQTEDLRRNSILLQLYNMICADRVNQDVAVPVREILGVFHTLPATKLFIPFLQTVENLLTQVGRDASLSDVQFVSLMMPSMQYLSPPQFTAVTHTIARRAAALQEAIEGSRVSRALYALFSALDRRENNGYIFLNDIKQVLDDVLVLGAKASFATANSSLRSSEAVGTTVRRGNDYGVKAGAKQLDLEEQHFFACGLPSCPMDRVAVAKWNVEQRSEAFADAALALTATLMTESVRTSTRKNTTSGAASMISNGSFSLWNSAGNMGPRSPSASVRSVTASPTRNEVDTGDESALQSPTAHNSSSTAAPPYGDSYRAPPALNSPLHEKTASEKSSSTPPDNGTASSAAMRTSVIVLTVPQAQQSDNNYGDFTANNHPNSSNTTGKQRVTRVQNPSVPTRNDIDTLRFTPLVFLQAMEAFLGLQPELIPSHRLPQGSTYFSSREAWQAQKAEAEAEQREHQKLRSMVNRPYKPLPPMSLAEDYSQERVVLRDLQLLHRAAENAVPLSSSKKAGSSSRPSKLEEDRFSELMERHQKRKELDHLARHDLRHVFVGVTPLDAQKLTDPNFSIPNDITTLSLAEFVAPICVLAGFAPAPRVQVPDIETFQQPDRDSQSSVATSPLRDMVHRTQTNIALEASLLSGGDASAAPRGKSMDASLSFTGSATATGGSGSPALNFWSMISRRLRVDFSSFVNQLSEFSPLAVSQRCLQRAAAMVPLDTYPTDPMVLAPVNPLLGALANWFRLMLRMTFLQHDFERDATRIPDRLLSPLTAAQEKVAVQPSSSLLAIASRNRPQSAAAQSTKAVSVHSGPVATEIVPSPLRPTRPHSATCGYQREQAAENEQATNKRRLNGVVDTFGATPPPVVKNNLFSRTYEPLDPRRAASSSSYSTTQPQPQSLSSRLAAALEPGTQDATRRVLAAPPRERNHIVDPSSHHGAVKTAGLSAQDINDALQLPGSVTTRRPSSGYVREAHKTYQLGSSMKAGSIVSSHTFFGDQSVVATSPRSQNGADANRSSSNLGLTAGNSSYRLVSRPLSRNYGGGQVSGNTSPPPAAIAGSTGSATPLVTSPKSTN